LSRYTAEKPDLLERRSRLSPVKQALLEQRLLAAGDPASGTGVIRTRADPDLVPLSFAQERLWFLDQLEPGNPVHNRPVALRLTGPLDAPALERSLGEIVRRHQVLRATFSNVEGRPVQTITPGAAVSLPLVDLSTDLAAVRECRARQLATEEALKPVDLTRGLLLRGTLLRLSVEEHVLVLVIHHIAFDAWSARVLVEELSALYEAFSSGTSSPLQELSIQYADFAHWQREHVQGEVLERQLAYWRARLTGCKPLNLPTDRPRPAIPTYRGAHQRATISHSLLRSLRRLSEAEDATLYMTLLAAFKVLLYRYTGQHDIVVGSPIAGRTPVDTEGLIGFFVNTLVLRTEVSGDPSFRELLGRVRETALGAYDRRDLPFEKLVAELRPERDLSRTPLFQVLFNLENLPETALGTESLGIGGFEFDSGVSQFDLGFELQEREGGLSCYVGYKTDLYDAGTISRMLGHYESLLESIVADPDSHISSLRLLTEDERHRVLVAWNDTAVDFPQDLCIHQLFEAQVERTAEAVAVILEGRKLIYRELNARANQLAHYLRRQGVGPNVLVGICVERSLEMVAGILGILKAGGAYVPLDPDYPWARQDHMLRDSQVALLITQERLVSRLPGYSGDVVCLDLDRWPFGEEDAANPEAISEPQDLAYSIYTSGSTGKPKGVLVAHRGAVNYLTFLVRAFHLDETDTVLQLPSMSFDASVRDIFGPLIVGARAVYVTNAEARSPTDLVSKIRHHKVTALLSLVPPMLRAIVDVSLARDFRCDSLRLMLVSGESLLWAERERARLALGETVRMVNQYGPTECTLTSTTYPIPGQASDQGIVPIGKPISNVEVYILDGHLNPVPVGVTGEICVGGIGLARGYHNRPAQTAKAFIPHPFGDQPGARLYSTGDLARYLPDGTIDFLGRRDSQVKIRGFRVELGEIEAMLGQHPAVQGAAIMAPDDNHGGKRLVAYVVPRRKPAPTTTELRSFLANRVPRHMLPSLFVMLDELPLTPTGKVDRQALPLPGSRRPSLEETFVAPRSPVEQVLTGIWSEVLGLEPIGVHDNFFELGGHSLLAIRVISRVRSALGVELPVRALFATPTIAGLGRSVETIRWTRRRLRHRDGEGTIGREVGAI
jgi:amino acid adenylation domain-containing protein